MKSHQTYGDRAIRPPRERVEPGRAYSLLLQRTACRTPHMRGTARRPAVSTGQRQETTPGREVVSCTVWVVYDRATSWAKKSLTAVCSSGQIRSVLSRRQQ